MLRKNFVFLIFASAMLLPASLQADTLNGIVRNVNYGSHSFGLDIPPLTRIYVNAGTKYKSPAENSLQGIKVGDEVEVKGRPMQTGTFLATKVTVTGHLSEVRDLAADDIKIKLEQRFLMGVNQTAALKEGGQTKLRLHSTEFINTLCKGGYDCVGEGEIGMRLEVKGNGEKNEIVLLSKNHRKPTSPVKVEVSGFEIQLVEAGEDVVLLVVRNAS